MLYGSDIIGSTPYGSTSVESEDWNVEWWLGGPGFKVGDLVEAKQIDYDYLGNPVEVYTIRARVIALESDGRAILRILQGIGYMTPEREGQIEFVRLGNVVDTTRQGYVRIVGEGTGAPFVEVADGISDFSQVGLLSTKKAHMGKLSSIIDTDFSPSPLPGYGHYTSHGFHKGNIVVKSVTPLALISGSIMIGNITGSAANAIKLTNQTDPALSGLFGYDATGASVFELLRTGFLKAKGIILADGGDLGKSAFFGGDFASTSYNSFTWTEGSLAVPSHPAAIVYDITSGGASGLTSSTTYIVFFDPSVSASTFQVQTLASYVPHTRKIPIAKVRTTTAGHLGLVITLLFSRKGESYDGADIIAQTVTAGKIFVEELSAITTSTGTLIIGTNGHLRSGQTAYDTGVGFWLGDVAGVKKFSIGNPAGNKLTWDGSVLGITGTINVTGGNAALTDLSNVDGVAGKIAGLTITPTELKATAAGNTTIVSSGATAFAAGPTGAPTFTVTQAGELTAAKATIKTSAGTKRIELRSADNELEFFEGGISKVRIGTNVFGIYPGMQISNGVLSSITNVFDAIYGETSGSAAAAIHGIATGVSATGVKGSASGISINYGIYGDAIGGFTNWAGYFNNGNVYIRNQLQIAGGAPGAGKVLVSDAAGFASWSNTLPSHAHSAADITSGTFADARIAVGNVTQHQASLSIAHTQITGGITTTIDFVDNDLVGHTMEFTNGILTGYVNF